MTIEFFGIAGFIVIVYALVSNRLFAFGRAQRDQALDIAARLVDDDRVTPEAKAIIARLPEGMMSARFAWKMSYVLVANFFRRKKAKSLPQDEVANDDLPADLQRDFNLVVRTTVMALLCTSPAALIAFAFTLAVLSFFRSANELTEQTLLEATADSDEADGHLWRHRKAA